MLRRCRTALISLPVALALTACGRLYELPPPEGDPVVLKPAEVATTWTDADGGTLTLKQDGTFVADKICIAIGFEDGLTQSGTGTWKQGSNKKQSIVSVTFDAAHPETGERKPDPWAALRRGKVWKLWTRVGDPDHDDPHCTLTSPAS
ncbi:hypothetical protein ACFQ6B_27670 [Streptomyces wedmorensis]|uniref:hypothetical protein n=1 Tax=Streptomyces wedmorensis TaxID=43759 RepID=UPI0036BC0C26